MVVCIVDLKWYGNLCRNFSKSTKYRFQYSACSKDLCKWLLTYFDAFWHNHWSTDLFFALAQPSYLGDVRTYACWLWFLYLLIPHHFLLNSVNLALFDQKVIFQESYTRTFKKNWVNQTRLKLRFKLKQTGFVLTFFSHNFFCRNSRIFLIC